jgi:integrase
MLPLLRDELATHAAAHRRAAEAYVFATATGAKHQATNIRKRVLAPAVQGANAALAQHEVEPLPDDLTPHSLRRTFASILVAKGEDPAYVMVQLGHATPHLTLSMYAKAMQRRDGERERLRALVDGQQWAPTGTSPISGDTDSSDRAAA